ncbi:MAG: hypothetical protein IPP53_10200 [Bacteroidetes bacterium]|nr:hypothetical protein [Bacteroidota bacterium]
MEQSLIVCLAETTITNIRFNRTDPLGIVLTVAIMLSILKIGVQHLELNIEFTTLIF